MSYIGAYSTRRHRYRGDIDRNENGEYGTNDTVVAVDHTDPDYNLVSSKLRRKLGERSDRHSPALDIDIPVELYPSSTEGHYHLYFPTLQLSWVQYRNLLTALADAGIISYAYYDHSRQRGETLLRPPHVNKQPRFAEGVEMQHRTVNELRSRSIRPLRTVDATRHSRMAIDDEVTGSDAQLEALLAEEEDIMERFGVTRGADPTNFGTIMLDDVLSPGEEIYPSGLSRVTRLIVASDGTYCYHAPRQADEVSVNGQRAVYCGPDVGYDPDHTNRVLATLRMMAIEYRRQFNHRFVSDNPTCFTIGTYLPDDVGMGDAVEAMWEAERAERTLDLF